MFCQALRNVPKSKLKIVIDGLNRIEDPRKRKLASEVYLRYFDANIPVIYWRLNMDDDFHGDQVLLDTYNELTGDLKKTHLNGDTKCFAGGFGRGKTMTCCNILKKAVISGYSGLYTTLNDIISSMYSSESYLARKELITVDFLVIDEFDSRHVAQTEKSADFFGRALEDVLRWRSQNAMPLFLCTNSPNPLETFSGAIKESMSSLWNHIDMVPVLGTDYRAKDK